MTGIGQSALVKRQFGWVKDGPDKRDKLYSTSVRAMKRVPKSVDLRRELPPVYDQGNINSCTRTR